MLHRGLSQLGSEKYLLEPVYISVQSQLGPSQVGGYAFFLLARLSVVVHQYREKWMEIWLPLVVRGFQVAPF